MEKKWTKELWNIEHLSFNENKLILLAGKNGTGKSTLLRTLIGLIKPTSGEILWNGKKKLENNTVGYVPEVPIIPPTANVKKWLQWLLGIPSLKNSFTEKMNQLYPSLDVTPFLGVPANRLSKGQMQRVQLWSALASQPKGLILDEPLSGLDPWAKGEFSQLVEEVLQAGLFVVMSSHEMTEKLRLCCQTTWLIENKTITTHSGCTLPK